MSGLDGYINTINAFSSILIPADPAAAAVFGVADVDAGTLHRTVGSFTEKFGHQVARWYLLGGPQPTPGTLGGQHVLRVAGLQDVDELEGTIFFGELDAQAVTLGATDFANLFYTNQAAAEALVAAFASSTVTPIDPRVGGSAGAFYLFYVASILVGMVYATNYPEHVLRTGVMGTGDGDPVFSDPANLISSPNLLPPAFGGTATIVSAWDYRGWFLPVRKPVEDLQYDALLDWQSGAASETAWNTLLTGMNTDNLLSV